MAKRKLEQCRNHRHFNSHFRRNGAVISEGGRHSIARTTKGHVAYPRHGNQDYGKGLRHAIVKMAIAIGLGLMIFAGAYALL